MAIQAINLTATKDVSHPADKTDPTIFQIGALDSRTSGMIQDKAANISISGNGTDDAEADVQVAQNEVSFLTVQFGLKGFKNYHDENGEVLFETERKVLGRTSYDVVKEKILRTLPEAIIEWLAGQISSMNALSFNEAKK